MGVFWARRTNHSLATGLIFYMHYPGAFLFNGRLRLAAEPFTYNFPAGDYTYDYRSSAVQAPKAYYQRPGA